MTIFILLTFLSIIFVKADTIVTKPPREILAEVNQTDGVRVNYSEGGPTMYMVNKWKTWYMYTYKQTSEVSKEHQEHFKILHSYLQRLEFLLKDEISNYMELFKKIDIEINIILYSVFQYRNDLNLYAFENDLNCILMKMLPEDRTNKDLLNHQYFLVSELTSLRKEMKFSMYKYFEFTCEDYLKNAESIQLIVNKIRTNVKLIILLEGLKSLEAKQKSLTITCSQESYIQSKQQEEIQFHLANLRYYHYPCHVTEENPGVIKHSETLDTDNQVTAKDYDQGQVRHKASAGIKENENEALEVISTDLQNSREENFTVQSNTQSKTDMTSQNSFPQGNILEANATVEDSALITDFNLDDKLKQNNIISSTPLPPYHSESIKHSETIDTDNQETTQNYDQGQVPHKAPTEIKQIGNEALEDIFSTDLQDSREENFTVQSNMQSKTEMKSQNSSPQGHILEANVIVEDSVLSADFNLDDKLKQNSIEKSTPLPPWYSQTSSVTVIGCIVALLVLLLLLLILKKYLKRKDLSSQDPSLTRYDTGLTMV